MPVGKIIRIDRRRNSYNGNPAYRITFADGQAFNTASDSSFAYGIGNKDMREGSLVTYEVGGRGTITRMGPAS